MRFTVRFVEAWPLPIGDAARHHVLCTDARQRGYPVHSRRRLHRHIVTWGESPGMRAAMVGLGLALAQPDRRVLVVKPATARY
jgi:hypothetical protein